MPDVPDPYRVLGVRRGATLAEIKSAHRRLAKSHHPDAGGDGMRFLAIQAAYQLLSDPAQRRQWDATHGPGPIGMDDVHDRGRGGPRRRPSTTKDRRASPARRPRETPAPDAARQGRPDANDGAPGRDPSQSTWTWSAAGVPWWQEGASRRSRRPEAPPEPASPAPGDASTPPGREADGRSARGPERRRTGESPGTGQAAAAGGPSRPGPGDRPDTSTGPADQGMPRPDPGMDVYARSSGAAWSAASRAYFRRVAAEIPRGARMGHSSWTGRVGWEPSAEEIARAAAGRPGRRRGRPTRRAAGPASGSPRPAPPSAAGSAAPPAPRTPPRATGSVAGDAARGPSTPRSQAAGSGAGDGGTHPAAIAGSRLRRLASRVARALQG